MTKNVLNFLFLFTKNFTGGKGILLLKDIPTYYHVGATKAVLCTEALLPRSEDVELHAYLSFTRMK